MSFLIIHQKSLADLQKSREDLIKLAQPTEKYLKMLNEQINQIDKQISTISGIIKSEIDKKQKILNCNHNWIVDNEYYYNERTHFICTLCDESK